MNYHHQLNRYKAKQRANVLSLLIGAVIVPIALVLYLSHLNAKIPKKGLKTYPRRVSMGRRG